MNEDLYKKQVGITVKRLQTFEIKLQECMLNLMMHGELSEWNKGSKDGDTIQIDNRLLQATEDNIIRQLLLLQESVQKALQRLKETI